MVSWHSPARRDTFHSSPPGTFVTAVDSPLADALRTRYLLERELGRGGMATVYLARDLQHDRPVALKVLHAEFAHAFGPERFLREIRLAARLSHPHILPVFDSGETAASLWYTMPYVEGESLRDRLRRERQLPVEDAVRITRQVAAALAYAHGHGVIHRDIKPENILLSENAPHEPGRGTATGEYEAVVADFGVALAADAVSTPRLTETGLAIGTVTYMSPEQAAGDRQLDGRSDIYSLGVVLYEMLAGEPPFTGPTAQAIAARRLTDVPKPLRPVRDSVTPGLEQAVMKALARAPADRFATAGQLADALDRGAEPAAREPRRGRPVPRPLSVALGAVLLALAAAALLLRSRPRPALDGSLVAVAPFEVLDPRVSLWREGLVDLLSRNLDGAGPLRTVSPTVVIRRWSGRADPESAAELGRRTGAGLALYGSLLPAGRDSVQLRATLFDVSHGHPVEEWTLADEAARVDRIADSLTLRVLRGLGRERPIGAVRLTGFGSTSLPVLKAFLQGEQHFRRAEWDSALSYYERAIAIDSTFAPALRRASTAIGWIRTGTDSLSTAYALRAGIHNHGLPPRDSLLIAADSLLASVLEAGPLMIRADTGWGHRLHRLFATLELATSRYPDDPEPWFLLGEAGAHAGPFAGRSYEQVLQAFDRSIALDSAYAPSYIHPIEISATYGAEAIRKYLRPYLTLSRQDASAEGAHLIERMLDSARGKPEPTALFEGVSDEALFTAHVALARLPDSAEIDVRLSRRIARRPLSMPPLNSPASANRSLARALMDRGHLKEADNLLLGQDLQPLFADAALVGAIPAERAAASFRERLSGAVASPLVAAFPWWAARRDTASLRRAEARTDSVARLGTQTERPFARYAAASAAAYLALTRADTSDAIQRFLALEFDVCPACYLDRLTAAQLLVERHRDQEAWRILRAEHPSDVLTPYPTAVLWVLLRGRVAERLGDQTRAVQSYAWVSGMWRNADPELRPYATEAREGLARLTAEGR
jgi:eukaryotic-like serine/threonine-protein kinase